MSLPGRVETFGQHFADDDETPDRRPAGGGARISDDWSTRCLLASLVARVLGGRTA